MTRRFALVSTVVAAALALGASGALGHGHAGKGGKAGTKLDGAVYTETNGSPNQVIVFDRHANGTLNEAQTVATEGTGGHQFQPGCPSPCPILDTQGEVILSPNGKLLFAVNAGSDSITSFRVTSSGLVEVGVTASGGPFPNSLTVHRNRLYVLDSGTGSTPPNIAGFTFSGKGKLTPIAGSIQPLVGGAIPGLPRQIGFDKTGTVLVVTLLANASGPPPAGGKSDTIDTFPVSSSGAAGAGSAHNSTSNFPFAFAIDPSNHAIVAQVDQLTGPPGSVASYDAAGGALTPLDSGVSSGGNAPCWVVITQNGKYAFVVNTGGPPFGPNVAEYSLSSSGTLTSLGNTTAVSGEFGNTDEALSSDDKYLYVLSPLEPPSYGMPGGSSHIDIYMVDAGGTLKFVGSTPSIPVPSLSGLAAR
jgi:6-phosphogluconolactonase (cycloisomerase 2 family)